MEKYEINEETLAIMPISKEKVRVYEIDNSFIVNQNIQKIMEDSCKYFGSSYEGRKKGTKDMIGVTYKAPIIIEESKEIIFFPTSSSRYNNPVWISLNHIKRYYKKGQLIVIEFQSGEKIELNISYGIIDNQILRATRLESVLRGRKDRKKRLNL